MMPYVRQRGFTLPELTVSMGILALMFAGFSGIFVTMTPVAESEVSLASLQVKTVGAGDKIVQDVRRGRLDPPNLNGTRITYQFPIDPDGDGELLDSAGEITWGMTIGGVDVPSASATIQYEVENQIDESSLGADVNGDGDRTDFFDVGRLTKILSDGTSVRLTGNWILQPQGDHGGDLDGDGNPDPIFEVQVAPGKKLATIHLLTVWPTGEDRWGQWNYRFTVLIRNDRP